MVVISVFVFLCRNYLDIVHLIIHIASHFYTLHFICTITLCIFLTLLFFQLLVNVKVDFHIIGIILFWQKTYLFLISPLGKIMLW
jgi:hypothetical protein